MLINTSAPRAIDVHIPAIHLRRWRTFFLFAMALHVYVNLQTFGYLVVASLHFITPRHYDYELLVIISRVAFIALAGSFQRIDHVPTSNVGRLSCVM